MCRLFKKRIVQICKPPLPKKEIAERHYTGGAPDSKDMIATCIVFSIHVTTSRNDLRKKQTDAYALNWNYLANKCFYLRSFILKHLVLLSSEHQVDYTTGFNITSKWEVLYKPERVRETGHQQGKYSFHFMAKRFFFPVWTAACLLVSFTEVRSSNLRLVDFRLQHPG